MHFEVFLLDLIVYKTCLLDWLREELFYLVHLATDQNLFFVILKDVEKNLLEYHDDEKVQRERLEVLIVTDGYKVRDVIIDELKEVDLIDHRILILLNVSMIFCFDEVA